jgi:DNA-binding response OmpR family regulator
VLSFIQSYDRRASKERPPSKLLLHGKLLIAPDERRVFANDTEITLTTMEFDILRYLRINKGAVLRFSQIFIEIWGEEYEDENIETLRTHIKRLRKKLTAASPSCAYIENVRNVGYRFSANINKD